MGKRVLFIYMSLRFFIFCLLLTGFSHASHAAKVQIAVEDNLVNNVLKKNPSITSSQITTKPKKNSPLFINLTTVFPTATQKIFFNIQQDGPIQPDIEAIGKSWITNNLDYEYIQDSLTLYSQVKNIYNDTNVFFVGLTEELLFTFELDQMIQLAPLLIEQDNSNTPSINKPSNAELLSIFQKINNRIPSSPTYQQKSIYHSASLNSNLKTTELFVYDEPDNIFLIFYKKIFHIETLILLTAFLFFFPILKWSFKQLLTKKY